MANGISVDRLNKTFGGFHLKNVYAEMPRGFVTAVIGNNGAGKTTLLKCIAGSYVPDSGSVRFGIKRGYGRMGVMFDECPYPPATRVSALSKTMSRIFDDWDPDRFQKLCEENRIDMDSRAGTLSRGKRMMLQAAVMLSHGTDYLILDEPTSGMDPEAKERFYGMLREYVSEDRTVVVASHMTSDLEKIADQVVLMIDGKVVICQDRASLAEEYGIVPLGNLEPPAEFVVGAAKGEFGSIALIKGRKEFSEKFPDVEVDEASLEDLVLYHIKGWQA